MRIVVDMQGAQTESRFRGIGRYTLSLAQAIVRNRGQHEIILALNGLFSNTIESIRAAFDGFLPQENIRVWYAPGPVRECEPGNTCRREVAERIREAFFASLQPDVIHLSSLFEGYLDDAVTSIGMFAQEIPTIVTLYDLIPLLNSENYLEPNPIYQKYYLRKIEHLKKANTWLAISEFTANEGRETLGFDAKSVVNISAACEPIFKKIEIYSHDKEKFLLKFGIVKPFIMYSGGADSRKNLWRLLQAYSMLPQPIRSQHQLVIVGKISEGDTHALRAAIRSTQVRNEDVVFAGYITDQELVKFYNLCKLFIFPSWHEGFGLPLLEAMSCGAAVIGSETSSIPEVIGRDDALFNPYSEAAIREKLAHVLRDDDFRIDLSRHSIEQAKKFSWDKSAQHAIHAFERFGVQIGSYPSDQIRSENRPTLAYVSPLPPERTGIANYSSELLPSLAKYYNIFVIVQQEKIKDIWVEANCQIRSSEWLIANASKIDRVLYQFGNSPFHQYMLPLLKKIPGAIVLHDFYLGNITWSLETYGIDHNAWHYELYYSHGYSALRERFDSKNDINLRTKYPANLSVLQAAQGIIVHSNYSCRLADEWYGNGFSCEWSVVPLLRAPPQEHDHVKIRQLLSLGQDNFVVCSFGFLDSTKLNHRLLNAWLHSRLSREQHCILIFVGENHGGEYGEFLLRTIQDSGVSKRIRITGWIADSEFRSYLAIADLAVQLRSLSRGETSAAIFDCMNYGLPTIVNANGSAAELTNDAVWMLPDDFTDDQLVNALECLFDDRQRRITLGERARKIIETEHTPTICAGKYFEAIENFYSKTRSGSRSLIDSIAMLDLEYSSNLELAAIAESIAQSLHTKRLKHLLIDLSATCQIDLKTGIERVVRGLAIALLNSPPQGYRVEPVYLSNIGNCWQYRYARRYTLDLIGCPVVDFSDEVVEPQNGDIIIGMDLAGQILIDAEKSGLLSRYKNIGVKIYFIIYDLLPILLPQAFPTGADIAHAQWLQTISKYDGAICISKSVAKEFSGWLENKNDILNRLRPFKIGWFHLGADVENSAPTYGLSNNIKYVLDQLEARPSFLMVGTIEPRKGYLQTLEAFTQLWQNGHDINLVIVGKEGWKHLPDNMRRTIPEIVERLRYHSELGKRLIWLEGISDEFLEKIYAASTCLIAASEGEGFGLPLIEAAQYKLPIIARNIPVFHEVMGEYPFYFESSDSDQLANLIAGWLVAFRANQTMHEFKWKTWKESAAMLLSVIINEKWTRYFTSKAIRTKAIEEHLKLIHAARVNMISNLLPQGDIILDLGGANCPLYKMGYPHHFKKLVLIDLPPEDRHDSYKEIVIDTNCHSGEVVIQYGDMTELNNFTDESVDFVWSGQSIEHIPAEAGERMCYAVFRVLKKGGAFCLDTPNRRLTKIHLHGANQRFIHPEHCIEYYPEELQRLLLNSGFEIKQALGICEMSNTLATGRFCYEDFIYGNQITDDVTSGYIQFFYCIKP